MAAPFENMERNRGESAEESEEETEEEEEEEEEGEDTFEADAALPAFDPKPPPAALNQRRGSVVQLGGRRASLSVQGELQAALQRLQRADESGDVNEMQAALQAAGPVAMMAGEEAAQVQELAMQMAVRMAEDEDLRATAGLRRSKHIREKLQRLWGLM
eukprot:COSAG01_NODE_37024_length_509_cov_1.343902_1_plen_158_part_01